MCKRRGSYSFLAASVSSWASLWFFVLEIKGLSSEAMNELFGVTALVKQLDHEPETGTSKSFEATSIQEEPISTSH